MKKAFIFDLDGVITDTAKYHYIAWKELAESIGISLTPAFNEQLKGISRMDSLERILAYGGKEQQFSAEEKQRLAEQKNTAYVQLLQDLTPEDVLPGVKSFLLAARQCGVPCGIASASNNAPFILDKLGVSAYFQHIVDPQSLTQGKPNPEIFLKAAAALGVSPEEAIGFEDAQAGIAAIKAAGMYAVGIIETEELTGADRQVHRLDELVIETLLAENI